MLDTLGAWKRKRNSGRALNRGRATTLLVLHKLSGRTRLVTGRGSGRGSGSIPAAGTIHRDGCRQALQEPTSLSLAHLLLLKGLG